MWDWLDPNKNGVANAFDPRQNGVGNAYNAVKNEFVNNKSKLRREILNEFVNNKSKLRGDILPEAAKWAGRINEVTKYLPYIGQATNAINTGIQGAERANKAAKSVGLGKPHRRVSPYHLAIGHHMARGCSMREAHARVKSSLF